MSPLAHALVAFVHLLGVVLSFGSLFARARALAKIPDADAQARVLMADSVWGISALIVLPTGFYRLFAAGKGLSFYLANPFFHTKMTAVGLLLVLELFPMIALVRHRLAAARGAAELDPAAAARFAKISMIQSVLLLIALLCATMVARGVGQMG